MSLVISFDFRAFACPKTGTDSWKQAGTKNAALVRGTTDFE